MEALAMFDVPANPSHPAKYTDSLLPVMAGMLKGRRRILDPFGGGCGGLLQAAVDKRAARIRAWWQAIGEGKTHV